MECTKKNLPDCSLVPFSPAKWQRLQRQRKETAASIDKKLAALNRLHRQMKALDEKSVKMVDDEVANIEDAEQVSQSKTR